MLLLFLIFINFNPQPTAMVNQAHASAQSSIFITGSSYQLQPAIGVQ
jgi:hypothetical protein